MITFELGNQQQSHMLDIEDVANIANIADVIGQWILDCVSYLQIMLPSIIVITALVISSHPQLLAVG